MQGPSALSGIGHYTDERRWLLLGVEGNVGNVGMLKRCVIGRMSGEYQAKVSFVADSVSNTVTELERKSRSIDVDVTNAGFQLSSQRQITTSPGWSLSHQSDGCTSTASPIPFEVSKDWRRTELKDTLGANLDASPDVGGEFGCCR